MAIYEGVSIHPRDPDTNGHSSSVSDLHTGFFDLRIKTLLKKMVFEMGLGCFLPPRTKSLSLDNKSLDNSGGEQNKAWLLAESGPELTNADPQSNHSSFRFSLCSQVELETMRMNSSASFSGKATVLMVNLENGMSETAKSEEMKWMRIQSLEKTISPVANDLIRFSYSEILSATRSFYKGRVLGRGACSYVFRGRIGMLRTTVAIKRLEKEDKESPKSFCRELMIASSLHNQNIVPLLGFCIDPEEGLFLVYKYVSGGSLERHLHDKKKKKGVKSSSGLNWSARYKVALGIADAIAFLHNGTDKCVVHRDIKPSNILLSSKKSPKLCDFGLATWTAAPSVPFLCKTVKGTFGYLAPEYFQHGKISDKTDVYAFGVVLLELITGRKPIEARRPQGEENLVVWAKPLLQKGSQSAEQLLDPKLKRKSKNTIEISRMMQAAAACVINEESRRPGIEEVIAILKGEEQEEEQSTQNNFKKKTNFSGITDCYPQLQRTRSEMKNHLDLAMGGFSDSEEDAHLKCRR